MIQLPNIETKNLLLRETKVSDFVDMFEYASLSNVGPVAGWAPHLNYGETRSILKQFEEKALYGQIRPFAVVLKKENKMIGTVELHTYVPNFKAELGYTISPYYWGHGYAYEASVAILEFAFLVLKLKRVECSCFIDNKQSMRVCEKLKFTYEGIKKNGYQLYDGSIHDLICYGMTDEEYLEKYKY